ncbi:MAG: hypothetical protein HOC74_04505 [Gemmatimonadetes bacterium]|jgi:hypothetical protein|nr:hypothetical protein [Gemmatimonadota bacterium]
MRGNSKARSRSNAGECALCIGVSLWLLVVGCDHGLEATPPGPTGISGRVTFIGIWPDEVEQVAVAVYREVPQQLEDFFALTGADTEVELGAENYDYFVPIEADGVYQWVVVAWRRKDSFWDFSSLLGCHYLPGEELPGQVAVRRGQVTRDIDIVVDLGILQGEKIPGMDICERVLPAELLAVRDQGD